MSSFRTEISIPVNKDSRTLEERRKEVFNVLEDKYNKPNVVENSRISPNNRPSLLSKRNHESFFDKDQFFKSDFDNWDSDVSEWMQNSRKRWDDEMARVRRSMFSLESDRDELDFNSWEPFRSSRRLGEFNKRESEIARHRHMINSHDTEKTMREFKNQVFSPSLVKTVIDDSEMLSNQQHHNFYEFGQDGQLHFKIRFDAKNFKPEDIKITCTGNNLNIAVQQSDNESIDLNKSIVVPNTVDSQKFQCHVTQDGVLVLEAPVKSPDYDSVVPQETFFTDKYKNQTNDRNHGLVIRNTTGPIVLNDEKGKRLHLQIPVDPEYLPSDFSVTTELNKISVKGRHEFKTNTSSSFKEFSQCYEIPESIDPMSVSFNVVDGMLIIEAIVQ